MIEVYFASIENVIGRFSNILKYTLNKRIINTSFGIISGQLFYQDYILDFLEVVRVTDLGKPMKKKYKYHFRNSQNNMIFRYDNVPHYPEFDSFPHRKHIGKNVSPSNEPLFYDILKEIDQQIAKVT